MDGKRLLKEIRLGDLLSYGPQGTALELEPLNVLIGPNASGKSNLLSALGLLAAAPNDLAKFLREEGGIQNWLWAGDERASSFVQVTLRDLTYRLTLDQVEGRPFVLDEFLLNEAGELVALYALQQGTLLQRNQEPNEDSFERHLEASEIRRDQAILSQIKDPKIYPELTWVGQQFGGFRFFRDWNLGRMSAARRPQQADLPSDFLLEDASNLGLVLSDLANNHPKVKRSILDRLQLLYDRVEDLTVHVQGGTVQVFFHEKGLRRPVPASRLSDGTLLFLGLLTILLHPAPPPVVCIEEPEIGLHPDAVHLLAELLIDAAARTQLFVTTHSDALVSALSEVPEAVVVCEWGEGGTILRRLESGRLTEWLERYRLGELWRMGEIGGNRAGSTGNGSAVGPGTATCC